MQPYIRLPEQGPATRSPLLPGLQPTLRQEPRPAGVRDAFEKFILQQDHPCIMARSAFKQDQVVIKTFDRMLQPETVTGILKGLKEYLAAYDPRTRKFYSFIAVFPKEPACTELVFERKLWQLLNCLHVMDPMPWDETVSDDPEDDDFSFSLCGKAFFLVGMHPGSSRKARRSPMPAIAFNMHLQFEHLREMGVYENVRDKIRQRDKAFQGTINPMLDDFGNASEARQYSGRAVGNDWKCPFHAK